MTGLDVQSRLRVLQIDLPVVFITARDKISLGLTLIAAGVWLLYKPFSHAELLDAVDAVLHRLPNAH
jgi:FixJ family two-component response regulator